MNLIFSFFHLLMICKNYPYNANIISETWSLEYNRMMTQRFSREEVTIPSFTKIETNIMNRFYYTDSKYSWDFTSFYIEYTLLKKWNKLNVQTHKLLLNICEDTFSYKSNHLPFDLQQYQFHYSNNQQYYSFESDTTETLSTIDWMNQYNPLVVISNYMIKQESEPIYHEDDHFFFIDEELESTTRQNRDNYLLQLCSFELNRFSHMYYNKTSNTIQYEIPSYPFLKTILQNVLIFGDRENDRKKIKTSKKMPKYNPDQIFQEKGRYLMDRLIQYEMTIREIFKNGDVGIYSLAEYLESTTNQWNTYSGTLYNGFYLFPLFQSEMERKDRFMEESEKIWNIHVQQDTKHSKLEHLEVTHYWDQQIQWFQTQVLIWCVQPFHTVYIVVLQQIGTAVYSLNQSILHFFLQAIAIIVVVWVFIQFSLQYMKQCFVQK